MKKRDLIALLLAAALLGGGLAGCSASGGSDDTASDTEGEVTTILIGNSGGPSPYAYTTDDDELTGYEVEVLREIDKLLPQYEFEFELTETASILAGLDSGRYQIGSHNYTWKEERAEKYLFAGEYFVYNYTVAVVAAGRDDIRVLDDLGGKKTRLNSEGGFAQIFIEHYNEENPDNEILVQYADSDSIKTLRDIVDGQIDFIFWETVMLNNYLEQYPELEGQVEYVEFSQEETSRIQDPYAWFLYPQTEEGEALRDAVDEALLILVENGRLRELSEEFFGFDMTGR